jgi:hypothetical protein
LAFHIRHSFLALKVSKLFPDGRIYRMKIGRGQPGQPAQPIPLGWPQAVGASERFIYVSDVLNRRIVRLARTYAAEQVCQAEDGSK